MSQMPNEFEFVIRHYWRRHRRAILFVLLAIVVLWGLGSIFYSVEADSEGVVLRLGAYLQTTQPGLHMKLPSPIDTVAVVPVQRIQTLEFGFATETPGRVTRYARSTPKTQTVASMLTGDLNLAHVEWIIQYRIKNAQDYLFKIGLGDRNSVDAAVRDIISDVSEAVMRRLVGDASVDEVITIGRDQIATDAKTEIQQMLDTFETGIEIVTVKLQAATPPDEVKDAFDAVNRARQNKERVVNEARGERNRLIPAARGSRDRAISEAEGYKERVVREMTGRGNAVLARLAEYERAPEVTKTRLYLETMEEILAQVDHKMVIDESIRGLLPLLNLDSDQPASAAPKGGAR